jgi:type IV pilus assembly protein PilM
MRFNAWQQILKGKASNLIHAPPIAVDLGTGSMKILQVGPGDPPSLVAAACLDTPPELVHDAAKRLTFQLEALPGLIKSCEFKGRRAVCALPASRTFCKHMQFQQEPGIPLSTLIKAAIPAQLKCEPEALVFRHVEVGPVARSNKTEVICMAAAREMVERLMQAFKVARLEPVGMHSEFTAALRTFDSITRRAEDRELTSLYLDIGAGCTKVAMAHGRNLVFARMIDLGGRHLDAAVSRQLKLDIAEARKRRLQMTQLAKSPTPSAAASPPGEARLTGRLAFLAQGGREEAREAAATATLEERREGKTLPGCTEDLTRAAPMGFEPPQADLSEPLEILTDEISMCLRYYESVFPDRRVDRAIFIGGEARHLGLCQHIARTLRLPAQVADPMARITRTGQEPVIGTDFTQSQPGWTVALGLCLCPTDL